MKKFMMTMLGLAFALSTIVPSFAQSPAGQDDTKKEEKKKKGKKKKTSDEDKK
jgi:hypothetical protein